MPSSLVHSNRRVDSHLSGWVRGFDCSDMRILIVCRGPVRKEAIDVFREMGVRRVGILISEKDSIVYTQALAPELRFVRPEDVHPVRDYTGATKEEREQRVSQIIGLCKDKGYEYVFAGYGFMAEDETFVAAIEQAGLNFVGPCSYTVRSAGKKDEAKRTALEQKVSVTPGIEDLTTRTLLAKAPDQAKLVSLAQEFRLAVEPASTALHAFANQVLDASYRAGVDIISVDEIASQLVLELKALFQEHPGRRVRLKAIGGGGGKGQRILSSPLNPNEIDKAAAEAPEKYREILSEVKAGGVGDNKNVLLELNVEQTRHAEIQLLGNGSWCIALGGRDCSLQMHEQKLLEISLTTETLSDEIDARRAANQTAQAASLEMERAVLARMEAEAERFGEAVKLDSASTFECIVEGASHYFMEVNTRIQVEHRVTELCYSLLFENPVDPEDKFEVTSLVQAMALIARHGHKLPKPKRILRSAAAVEARLNATDRGLDPSANGIIEYWSDPIEGEVRDDQGICTKNPDTGEFIRYRIAGAYDSNIALLVSVGDSRRASYEHLKNVLQVTKLSGQDLSTNLDFHFGLVNFFLSTDVYAKPTTKFVTPYLTMVGRLFEEAKRLDLGYAEQLLVRRRSQGLSQDESREVTRLMDRRRTLIERPLKLLLREPHILSGWLSALRSHYRVEQGQVRWTINPVRVLRETYKVINMWTNRGLPAAQLIWDHDRAMIDSACSFYDRVEQDLGSDHWPELSKTLEGDARPDAFGPELWPRVQAAHAWHQLGLEILNILPVLAERAGFYDFRVRDDLTVEVPDFAKDPELQARMKKVLVPPPAASGDTLVAPTGGMFYAREAPDRPPMLEVGSRFQAGQPVFIIEVMKMFNKVSAPFSGQVLEVLGGADGTIVKKGQPLFRVLPDVPPAEVDEAAEQAQKRTHTEKVMAPIVA